MESVTLKTNYVVDGLPDKFDNYGCSEPLLIKTIYGSLFTGYFRIGAFTDGHFFPTYESKPYTIREVVCYYYLGDIV